MNLTGSTVVIPTVIHKVMPRLIAVRIRLASCSSTCFKQPPIRKLSLRYRREFGEHFWVWCTFWHLFSLPASYCWSTSSYANSNTRKSLHYLPRDTALIVGDLAGETHRVGSSLTLTISLPKFSLAVNRWKREAFFRPSTTSSLYLSLPSCNHRKHRLNWTHRCW